MTNVNCTWLFYSECLDFSYLVKECVKHTYLTRGTILLAYTDILNGLIFDAVIYLMRYSH